MIDGPAATARFDYPQGVAIDSAGNVYVSDTGNNRIRRIDPTGVVETVAGDGTRAFRDGDGDQAEFFGAEGLDVTSDGKTIYVADGNGGGTELFNRVRAITMP
jgi:DNA-binding beta-propeller fold protein YncE